MNLAQRQLLATLKDSNRAWPWEVENLLDLPEIDGASDAREDWIVFESKYGMGRDRNHAAGRWIEQPREWWLEQAAKVLTRDEILEVLLALEET